MCSSGQNQTRKKSVDTLGKSKSPGKELGTGVFLVPAPEKGVLAYRTVNVTSLSYEETVRRGHNCTAFQWVSAKEASLEEIEANQRKCSGFCNFSGGWCPPGCICGPGNFCS